MPDHPPVKPKDDEPEVSVESDSMPDTASRPLSAKESGIPTRTDSSESSLLDDDDGEPVIGQKLARRYVLEKRLGSGGMGIVFRARDDTLGKPVALKVMRAHVLAGRGALERFYNEVKVAQDITDRGVCRVFDVGEDGPLRFLTMELVEGYTLRQIVRTKKPTADEVFGYLVQSAQALAKVHNKDILHRDLKPDNVMVRDDGTTVLMDFGLARHAAPEHTTTTVALGTPSYMSPEQLKHEKLDIRSDVFSFGVMAFELLAGFLPFAGISRDDRAPFVLAEWDPEIVQAMESFFVRALAKLHEERFVSAAEMLEAFQRARAGKVIERVKRADTASDAPVVASKSKPTARVKRSTWITLAVVCLFVGIAVGVRMVPRRTEVATVSKLDTKFVERDILTEFDWRPIVEVHAFKNSSGEAQWNSFAESAADSFRSHLRTYPKLRVIDAAQNATGLKLTWMVDGTVQKMGDKLRLSVEVHDANNTSPVPPIEVDGVPDETGKLIEKARDILLDDLRRLARFKERDRKAIAGTKNEEARKLMQKYYELVGANPQPKKEDFDLGKKLLDSARALDPEYVSTLVERAYLSALGVGHASQLEGVRAGLSDLQQALTTTPNDPDALVMRCRLLRQTVEVDAQPTDEKINAAINACDTALKADPLSAQVRLAYGRLYDRMCEEDLAIEALDGALQLDRSLSGTVYFQLMALTLHPNRLSMAERYSDEFVQFQDNNHYKTRAGRGAYLMRGTVLLRLAHENPSRYDDARIAFEQEITRPHAQAVESWMEAAAIRGLMQVAKAQRKTLPEQYLQRLHAIENDAERTFKSDPSVAVGIASSYAGSDPDTALQWLEKLGPPKIFGDALWHVLLLREAGRERDARQMLAALPAKEQWERKCMAWARRLLP